MSDAINTTVGSDSKSLTGLYVYNVDSSEISAGPKIWDGSSWLSLITDKSNISASNGLTNIDNNIKLGGELSNPTIIKAGTIGNNLEFNSSNAGSNFVVTGAA